jgi:hypothetical protein
MKLSVNRLLESNAATIFVFLYGMIIQIVALPAIYYYNMAYQDSTSVYEKLVFIWFCIPMISVLAILLASIQIAVRRKRQEKWKTPLIGLILNFLWLASYLAILYLLFVVKTSSFLIP